MMLYNLVQTIFRSLRATKSHVKTRIMQTTAVVARITKFQSKSDRKSFPSNSRSLFNIFKLCGFDFRGLFYIYLKFHFAVYPTFNTVLNLDNFRVAFRCQDISNILKVRCWDITNM